VHNLLTMYQTQVLADSAEGWGHTCTEEQLPSKQTGPVACAVWVSRP
jgi:hypothetical protein